MAQVNDRSLFSYQPVSVKLTRLPFPTCTRQASHQHDMQKVASSSITTMKNREGLENCKEELKELRSRLVPLVKVGQALLLSPSCPPWCSNPNLFNSGRSTGIAYQAISARRRHHYHRQQAHFKVAILVRQQHRRCARFCPHLLLPLFQFPPLGLRRHGQRGQRKLGQAKTE